MDSHAVFWGVLALLFLFILFVAWRKKRGLRALCYATIFGVLTLFPVQFLLEQLGVSLGINEKTLAISAVLGVPGTVLLAIYATFFG